MTDSAETTEKTIESSTESPKIISNIDAYITKLASENKDGNNKGELHTLKQVQSDLRRNPKAAQELSKHFDRMSEVVRDRVTNYGEGVDKAWDTFALALPEGGPYAAGKTELLVAGGHGERATLRMVGSLDREDLRGKPFNYDTVKFTGLDGEPTNGAISLGNELVVFQGGTLAVPEPVYEMMADAYKSQI